ncbi:subunit of the signal recognition particle [Monoraphidium neglectum]|uniref:Signal recognition particle subunit SRP72 n=1 Tax=Monoraphidium neglectum TaxID=145388 RepID=A0A0D2KIY4_9CHLO|nr:subunit of the signal recognition particle [Monoraphidium neglectum]KIY95778.1 subunit of the signal recognition particle [Monoraphidium neglectum]|eukprot:XP_013894798.1 subunit of the signal recognition particle [Monoraphidium neglectum]
MPSWPPRAEALERLEPLVGGELSDPATSAVAANNIVVEAYAADPHQKGFYGRSIKRLDGLLDRSSADPLALAQGLGTRLSAAQRRALHLNRALLYLLGGKADAARDLAGHLSKAFPDSPLVIMLQAVLLARGGKVAEADKLLSSLASGADADGDAALAPQLLRAQLALEDGDAAGALARLAALGGGLAAAPGVLATRVALLEQVGDTAGAEALLESALGEYQNAARADPRDEAASEAVGWCLQRLVVLKLQLDKAAEATKLFLQQQQQQQGGRRGAAAAAATPADRAVLARLARAAAAAGDTGAVAVLAERLPGGADAAGRGLDPDALEDLTRALNSVRAQRRREAEAEASAAPADAAGKRRRGAGGEDGAAAKKKRKRKQRLPKGYDPSKPNGGLPPPDPERWLPKWQRSDFKKKQKRRRDRTEGPVKGSQGAGKVDDSLDRAAKKADAMEVDPKGKGPAGGARPSLPQRKGGKK